MNCYDKLSRLIVNHSTKVKKGDFVVVENFDVPNGMTSSLIREIKKSDATPVVWIKSWYVLRSLLKNCKAKDIETLANIELELSPNYISFIDC